MVGFKEEGFVRRLTTEITEYFCHFHETSPAEVTDKKNQHYVPKFYLRNFSLQGNGRQIRLYNISSGTFVETAPLRHQGSSPFYYGKDGQIEDALSVLEGRQAKILKSVVEGDVRIKHGSKEFFELLGFVITTESRNPVKKNMLDDAHKKMSDYFASLDWAGDSELAKGLAKSDSIKIALEQINRTIDHCLDLRFKILINETTTSFITSDNPVVRYNSYLENRTKMMSISGFGMRGFQMFVPVSETLLILFYDEQVYYVGAKRSHVVPIDKLSDVNQLNALQLHNAHSNLYGGDRMTKQYITSLAESTNIQKTVNTAKVAVYKSKAKEHDELLTTGIESLRLNLSLSFIYLSTFASRYKLTSSYASFIRPHSLRQG